VDVKLAEDTEYAAFDATVTYPAGVTYTSGSHITDSTGTWTITDTPASHTVRILRVGTDATATSEPVATLIFTPSTSGELTFNLAGTIGIQGQVEDSEDEDYPANPYVTVTVGSGESWDAVLVADTNLAPTGYSLLKVTSNYQPAGGFSYGSDGIGLFYSSKLSTGGSYVYLYIVNDANSEAAKAKVTAVTEEGTVPEIAYSGDVNGNNKTNIFDAQIAYDLSVGHASYTGDTTFAKLSVAQRLEADYDGNGKVELADATAIMAALLP
jgi:hypothetical protein